MLENNGQGGMLENNGQIVFFTPNIKFIAYAFSNQLIGIQLGSTSWSWNDPTNERKIGPNNLGYWDDA